MTTASDAMNGARLLRLTRQQVSPTPVIALGRADLLGMLAIDPLGSFAVTVATLTDPAIEGALASGDGSPVEDVARPPARGARQPARTRSSSNDGPGMHPVAVRAPTMPAPAAADTQRRGRLRPRPSRPAAAPTAPPFTGAGPIPAPPSAAPVGHVDRPNLIAAPRLVAALAGDPPPMSPRSAAASWARRAAAIGGSTPVDVPAGPSRTDAEGGAPRPSNRGGNADGGRFTPAAPIGSSEFATGRTSPPAPAPVSPPVAPAMTGSDVRQTSGSQLAGLAHWWNEAHGPAEAPARLAEAGAATVAAPTVEPHHASDSTASSLAAPMAGAGDLRAVFGGLLEELLLTEARADGIEVSP
jgi:hypothetical protein